MASKSRWILVLALMMTISASAAFAQSEKKETAKARSLPTGYLRTEDWLKQPTNALEPGEIDRLVGAELKKAGIEPAPRSNDEAFLRRVYLDLVGRLPMPAEFTGFYLDKEPNKRARLIDRLLETEEYAKHWAAYWREAIVSRAPDMRAQVLARSFETWLAEQFKQNRPWGSIVRDVLGASGQVRFDDPSKNGQAFFLASRFGADAGTELASETSRLFLGIQIQCAQCHDHPSDVWKRHQFHEFAAFFVRIRQTPVRDGTKVVGLQLVSLPFAEHSMPDRDDPKKGKRVDPRFLDGKGPGAAVTDAKRRDYLATNLTSDKNPWFAGAFVNRLWGELMGQAFYQPIDDMGPEKEALMPNVLARVSASFRGSDCDVKQLFRDIMTSETYQRRIRPGASVDEHLLFAASHPSRMKADALWNSLAQVLGPFGGKGPFAAKLMPGPFARFAGLEGMFKKEFGFDPSAKPEEVEGSISQALMLMNNPQINQKIQAKGDNLLSRVLKTYPQDDEAIRIVYIRTLAREPSERDLARCKQHIASAANRAEAYEDILWALLNSAEFQTKK